MWLSIKCISIQVAAGTTPGSYELPSISGTATGSGSLTFATNAEVLFVEPQVVITIGSLPEELPKALLSLHPDIKIHYNYIILEGEVMSYQPDVLHILLDYKVNIVQLIQKRATLEDIYLEALHS